MSILRDGHISTHADPTSTRRTIPVFHERRIWSVTFTVGKDVHHKLRFPVAGRFVRFVGFWGANFLKMEILCRGRDEPP